MTRAFLVVVTLLSSACGSAVFLPPAPEPAAPPPALAITGDRPDLTYGLADDADPVLPGLQIALRVDVRDELIREVTLDVGPVTGALSDVAAEDLDGQRIALFEVTLDATTPVRASTPELDVEARATLVIRAGE